jgi:hypothetical protein
MTTDKIDTASPDALNKLAAELWPELSYHNVMGWTSAGSVFVQEIIGFAASVDLQQPLLSELIGKGWDAKVEGDSGGWFCSLWLFPYENGEAIVEATGDTEPLCRLRCILKAKIIQNETEKGEME